MADEGSEIKWPREEERRGVRIRHGSKELQGRLAIWEVVAASHLLPLTVIIIPGALDNECTGCTNQLNTACTFVPHPRTTTCAPGACRNCPRCYKRCEENKAQLRYFRLSVSIRGRISICIRHN